jgi:hypothetical protein
MEQILAFLSEIVSALRPQPHHSASSGGSGLSWAWYLLIVLAAAGAIYLAWRFVAGRRAAAHAGIEHASGAAGETQIADAAQVRGVETSIETPPDIEIDVPDGPPVTLAQACARLIDEIDRAAAYADTGGRAIAEHASSRMREILERSGANPIEQEMQ